MLKGFDKVLITDIILIDLQKALNTIDHGISYINDMSQAVRCNLFLTAMIHVWLVNIKLSMKLASSG